MYVGNLQIGMVNVKMSFSIIGPEDTNMGDNEVVFRAISFLMMHGYLCRGSVVDVLPDGRTIVKRPDDSCGDLLSIIVGEPNQDPWQSEGAVYTIAESTPIW